MVKVSRGRSGQLGLVAALALVGLLQHHQASGFFLPVGGPRARGRHAAAAPTTARVRLSASSTAGGLTVTAQSEGTGNGAGTGEASGGRPAWLEELAQVRETRLLRVPYELRRVDWGPEDDAAVDALLVAGQAAEAQAYFGERRAASVPVFRQTLRYHWTQTDTQISVGVPVPRPVRGSSMHLIVAEDALQMALIDDPDFGVVAGKFAGQIDPSTSGWRLVELPDGSFAVSMTLQKVSQAGTHSLWYQLFQGEQPATTLKFKGATPQYHWAQDPEFMNAFFPVPEGVRGKAVSLVIDAGGTGLTLRHPKEGGGGDEGGQVEIRGDFSGVVAPDECSWVIDEDETGQRCVCLSLRKRRRETQESTWWPRFFVEEEALSPVEEKAALEAARAAARAQQEAMDKELFGEALLDWIDEDGQGQGQEGSGEGAN